MIRTLWSPITFLFAVGCLQWVALAEIGLFTLLLPYFAFAVVALFAALNGRKLIASASYIRHNVVWLTPLLTYLVLMTAILWGSPVQTFSPRQIYLLVAGIGLGGSIAAARRLGWLFRVGPALGLLVLIIFIEFLARRIGLSWVDAIREFFGRGNLKFIVYNFFAAIFNSIDQNSSDKFGASTKNDVANVLLVLAIVFRSGSARPHRDIVGMCYMGAALGLLIMLNDRSVLIAAAGSLLVATVLGAIARPISNITLLSAKMIALFAVVVVAVGSLTTDSGVFGTLRNRFSFDDYSTSARLNQYQGAFRMIAKHPITGNGYFAVDGYSIHNAFLNAWAYGGALAFLLVVFFYLTVLTRWISSIRSVIRSREWWVLPIAVEWVLALPLMPLFRMWLSGEGGILKFGEWLAISIFFGCLLANQLRRRKFSQWVARQQGAGQVAALAAVWPHGQPAHVTGRSGPTSSALTRLRRCRTWISDH